LTMPRQIDHRAAAFRQTGDDLTPHPSIETRAVQKEDGRPIRRARLNVMQQFSTSTVGPVVP
jgi:hypothetical protein